MMSDFRYTIYITIHPMSVIPMSELNSLINAQWLQTEFLDYLDTWESEVQTLPAEIAQSVKNKMCLSRETIEGLRMTGLL